MPNNKVVNFQMRQPGEMANQQVVGVQQQNRLSLAERLRRYGLDQGESGPQSFADSFNQQMMYGRQQQGEATPQTPQQQQAGQIMKSYNAKGGGSEMGWKPSAPRSAQPGMMGSMSRGADAVGGAVSRGASSAGRGMASAAAGIGRLFA